MQGGGGGEAIPFFIAHPKEPLQQSTLSEVSDGEGEGTESGFIQKLLHRTQERARTIIY